MRKLIYGEPDRVIEWMRSRMPYAPAWAADIEALGIENEHGELVCGIAYEDFTACDCNMHVVGAGTNWITREALVRAFYYPFQIRKLRRVTALVAAKNRAAFRVALHLGFQMEGIKRDALPDGDLIILGMTRDSCRFIGRAT